MPPSTSTLVSWGRLRIPGYERLAEDLEHATHDVPLTRGLGRSYGDSAFPASGAGIVAGSRLADRILGFDAERGVLHAEAGLTLGEMSRLLPPRGWASPVFTGTQYVTLGGMVASDVHGKNHHVAGTIGRHVERLRLRLASGEITWCSRDVHPDLFRATLGGMGLTGHILEVVVRLERVPTPWIWQESQRIPDLEAFLTGLAEAAESWPMTVGWIDCLTRGRHMGRGILNRGRWATREEAPPEPPAQKRRLRVPIDFPGWALNPLSMRLFNMAYYWKHLPRLRRGIVHPETFFHPLDGILEWNRIYGKRGFTQHQSVIPKESGAAGVRRFLDLLTRLGAASFLCVIKDCGDEGEGTLSFPKPGISIALDIPIRYNTEAVIAQLNACVIEEGGRIYLTKDTFTTAEDFRAMEPRLEEFLEIKRRWDPEGRLRSAQSARVLEAPTGKSP